MLKNEIEDKNLVEERNKLEEFIPDETREFLLKMLKNSLLISQY